MVHRAPATSPQRGHGHLHRADHAALRSDVTGDAPRQLGQRPRRPTPQVPRGDAEARCGRGRGRPPRDLGPERGSPRPRAAASRRRRGPRPRHRPVGQPLVPEQRGPSRRADRHRDRALERVDRARDLTREGRAAASPGSGRGRPCSGGGHRPPGSPRGRDGRGRVLARPAPHRRLAQRAPDHRRGHRSGPVALAEQGATPARGGGRSGVRPVRQRRGGPGAHRRAAGSLAPTTRAGASFRRWGRRPDPSPRPRRRILAPRGPRSRRGPRARTRRRGARPCVRLGRRPSSPGMRCGRRPPRDGRSDLRTGRAGGRLARAGPGGSGLARPARTSAGAPPGRRARPHGRRDPARGPPQRSGPQPRRRSVRRDRGPHGLGAGTDDGRHGGHRPDGPRHARPADGRSPRPRRRDDRVREVGAAPVVDRRAGPRQPPRGCRVRPRRS